MKIQDMTNCSTKREILYTFLILNQAKQEEEFKHEKQVFSFLVLKTVVAIIIFRTLFDFYCINTAPPSSVVCHFYQYSFDVRPYQGFCSTLLNNFIKCPRGKITSPLFWVLVVHQMLCNCLFSWPQTFYQFRCVLKFDELRVLLCFFCNGRDRSS